MLAWCVEPRASGRGVYLGQRWNKSAKTDIKMSNADTTGARSPERYSVGEIVRAAYMLIQ